MSLSRRQVVAGVIAEAGDALVIAGLGTPCWDLYETGDRPEFFYMWNAMGLTVPAGLGLALAQPGRKVLVVTGDGDMMMGIGSLAVIGSQAPANLGILVLDNEMFGETGGQAGLTSRGADIAAIARGAGIAQAVTVRTPDECEGLAGFLLGGGGPALAVAKVAASKDPARYPSRDGAMLANRFRAAASGR
ncbi:MAG: thiamine pyrophosphate-dependent enzyme [Hyphomicrobiales bacterium]